MASDNLKSTVHSLLVLPGAHISPSLRGVVHWLRRLYRLRWLQCDVVSVSSQNRIYEKPLTISESKRERRGGGGGAVILYDMRMKGRN